MSITYPAAGPVAGLAGQLVLAGDPDYDRARQAGNLALDQRPAAVIWPESAADVAAAVGHAAGRGLRIAPQGTGHGAAPLGPLDGTILLRTERMRGIRIDPRARIARTEAGVAWLDIVEAAARHGLAALAGSSPDTGVTGYTLGGGISFLGRTFGLAANSVTAIEVVTADGHLVRADHEYQPDLFWALRGGGGSFGVVTALEFRLFPVTEAYAGALWYPIERGSEVLHAWARLTRGAPDELTTVGRFLRLPPLPSIPAEIRGREFVLVEGYHVGDPARADGLLAPLRALGPVNDTITTVPMPADVPELHRDTAPRRAVLDRTGLPPAAPDQGRRRPSRPRPGQPPGPASLMKRTLASPEPRARSLHFLPMRPDSPVQLVRGIAGQDLPGTTDRAPGDSAGEGVIAAVGPGPF
jgi:FAD/FMN-containing dehydrogenase